MLPENNNSSAIKVKTKLCETKTPLDSTVVLTNENHTALFLTSNRHSNKTKPTLEKVNYYDSPNVQVVAKNHHANGSNKNENEQLLEKGNDITVVREFQNAKPNKTMLESDRRKSLESDSNDKYENRSESESEKAIRKKVKTRKRWWATGDAVISGFVVCTLGVGSWRGLWELMNLYPEVFPIWPSMLTGISIHLIFAFLRGPLHKHMSQQETSRAFQWWRAIAGRLYCWLFMCACVLQWRGQWALWAKHVVPDPWKSIPLNSQLAAWTGVCALTSLKSLRNLLAMPYFVAVDNPDTTYNFFTRFRTNSREPFLFVLDCVFSVVVVGSLVVFVWRGAWDLLDYYLYPQDKTWSAWSSAILGYGLALLTFLLQPLARRACSHLQAARRLLLADLFLFLSFVATINVWRSVWNLLDIYFIPENPLLSNWITHAGCLILLMLLNCANSVMVRGVYIDAEEDGGQCVVFPCYYLRLFFQKERAKKRQKRLEKAAAASLKGELDPGVMSLVTKVHAANHVMVSIPEREACLDKESS